MKNNWKVRAALRPDTIDRFAISRNRPFERRVHRRNFELKRRARFPERASLDAIDALVEAIDRRDRDSILRRADMQNKMQHVVTRLQRTRPVSSQRLPVSRNRSLRLLLCVGLCKGSPGRRTPHKRQCGDPSADPHLVHPLFQQSQTRSKSSPITRIDGATPAKSWKPPSSIRTSSPSIFRPTKKRHAAACRPCSVPSPSKPKNP